MEMTVANLDFINKIMSKLNPKWTFSENASYETYEEYLYMNKLNLEQKCEDKVDKSQARLSDFIRIIDISNQYKAA